MTYKATVEYRAVVHVIFDTPDNLPDEELQQLAVEEADEGYERNLSVYGVRDLRPCAKGER